MLKCTNHPKYKDIKPPRKTEKYPKGCPTCWWIYSNRKAKETGFDINYKETVGIGRLGSVYNW